MTGSFDKDNTTFQFIATYVSAFKGNDTGDIDDPEPFLYLAICTIFTYIFTAVIFWFLFKETNHIIKTRQKFLGSQRSLTDRTIFIKNIPQDMCNEIDLKKHVQELSVGKVDQIHFVYDYTPLIKLFEKRNHIVSELEIVLSKSCGLEINLFNETDIKGVHLKVVRSKVPPSKDMIIYDPDKFSEDYESASVCVLANYSNDTFDDKRRSCFKFKNSDKQLIDSLSRQLIHINDEISCLKDSFEFKRTNLAFVTMDSVTEAQMAAQAVFSPKVFELVTELAPAPLDINWNNLLLDNKALFLRKNIIEVIIIVFSILLIIPIRYITSLLNVNSIRKIWKEFGDYLLKHEKIRTIVTGLLPTYLFSIINSILPYVISSLSQLQGLGSKGDVELSVIKKNFLYIFFNLFLVFTLFGTLSSYKALLTDTTKIAPLLATSIKSLSLFYIDLILLQGLTMFPFKLLQIGDLSILFWNFIINFKTRTPRLFKESLYTPPIFDLGLILPQHLMIFIITIIYSAISTKIVVAGLVYFILGFYTYKYQLVYSLVHPYHSTGKAWLIIFKRICLGVFFLHLQMFGSLALEHSFVLAGLMLPLFPTTLVAMMFFDRHYQPLLHYIALDAIKTKGKSVGPTSDLDGFDSLLTGLTNENNIQRKSSMKSLNNFLNGFENCDAVEVDHSNESLPDLQYLDEAVILSDNEERFNANNNNSGKKGPFKSIKSTKNDTCAMNDKNSSVASIENSTGSNNFQSVHNASIECTNDLTPHSLINSFPMAFDMNRKCSTIEEAREALQCYIHPCLLESMDGVVIGFQNDDIDYLDFRLIASSLREDIQPPCQEVSRTQNDPIEPKPLFAVKVGVPGTERLVKSYKSELFLNLLMYPFP